MANYNVWGFGGIRFLRVPTSTTYIATFPYSFGQLKYTPEYDEIVNANKKIIRKFNGFRAKVSCKLYSAEDNMYEQIQILINIINYVNQHNTGLTIQPEYASTNNNNLMLEGMLFDSDFALEDIVKREGIQGLTLNFIAEDLVDDIPLLTNSGQSTFVNQNADIFVDESGDTFVFE